MHNKYRRQSASKGDSGLLRKQIASEAARLLTRQMPPSVDDLDALTAGALALAKRQAVSLLGQRVRESDLPTDSEVRVQYLAFARQGVSSAQDAGVSQGGEVSRMADHLDRFAIYRMRLEPLATVMLNPKTHPEGDALYHSLQVFEAGRLSRPYDEEFLLATLLHHVGQAIDPIDPVGAGIAALEGTITERTRWLIEQLPPSLPTPHQTALPRLGAATRGHEHFDDLELLRTLDLAARVPGAPVCSVEEAVEYLRRLEAANSGDDEQPLWVEE